MTPTHWTWSASTGGAYVLARSLLPDRLRPAAEGHVFIVPHTTCGVALLSPDELDEAIRLLAECRALLALLDRDVALMRRALPPRIVRAR